MDQTSSEEPIRPIIHKRRLTFTSAKAVNGNEFSSANLLDKTRMTTPEMATETEPNVLEIPTNKTIELDKTADISNENQSSPGLGSQSEFNIVSKDFNEEVLKAVIRDEPGTIDVSSNVPAPKINFESLLCEFPTEQALLEAFPNEISSKALSETNPDSASCTIISNDTLTHPLPAEPIDNVLQNIESKSATAMPVVTTQASTAISTTKIAAFQGKVKDVSLFPVQNNEAKASASEDNTQKLTANITTSSVNTASKCTTETQHLQQVQLQQSTPESSKVQASPHVPTQTSCETSESDTAQAYKIVPELLSNLTPLPNKNSTIPNFSDQVVLVGTASGTPEVQKTVQFGVMERNNSRKFTGGLEMLSMTGSAVVSVMKLFGKKKKEYEIVSKEQQYPSETVGVKQTTLIEAEKLEGMEVSSDAIPEGRQNPAEGPITQFETPRRPASR
uniref:Bm9972 n=1 Tax=Brugia malayi TaxID=6279 RepID=A0A0J9XVV6_BRUMA|nr:Bm9972 [Brugia malayi]